MLICISVLSVFLVSCGEEESADGTKIEKEHPLVIEGLQYMEEKNYEKALMQLQELLNRDPMHTHAMVALARVFIKQERYADAISWSKKALNLESNLAGAYDVLGEVYFRTSRFHDALDKCRIALIMDPTLPSPYRVIGSIFLRRGQVEKSIKVLEEGLKWKSGDILILEKLGAAYIKAKDYQKALEYLNIAFEVDPQHPGIHFSLAVVYSNMENGQMAMHHISLAEQLYSEIGNTRWTSQSRHNKNAIAEKFKMRPEDILQQ